MLSGCEGQYYGVDPMFMADEPDGAAPAGGTASATPGPARPGRAWPGGAAQDWCQNAPAATCLDRVIAGDGVSSGSARTASATAGKTVGSAGGRAAAGLRGHPALGGHPPLPRPPAS